jgi:hypothetical protein
MCQVSFPSTRSPLVHFLELQMFLEDYITGGEEMSCDSALFLLQNYYQDEEIGQLECVALHQAHFKHLDLDQLSGKPIRSNPSWPCIRLVPLDHLYRAMKCIKDPATGTIIWRPGSPEFYRARTTEDEDGTIRWTGSEKDGNVHSQMTKSANYIVLLLEQECRGISSPLVCHCLRYFSYRQALSIVDGSSLRHRFFERGKERPDADHLILILRGETESDFFYAPFNLYA